MGKPGKGILFIVSAPSGTGKTTLCQAMTRFFPDLYYSISYTTRPPRPGDREGRDYYFITKAEFQAMVARGDFAEWAEIYGYYYGTSRAILEKKLQEGQHVILDIDGQGAKQLREQKWPGVFIFILPPSLEELKRRLTKRQTENPAAYEQRINKAKVEISEARWYDYIIVNDVLKKAQEELKAIILAEQCRRARKEYKLAEILDQDC
ncbi:MAG: guanylate kinase [Thermodesulfobacteriota bacterium]